MAIKFGRDHFLVVEVDGKRHGGFAVGKTLLHVPGKEDEVRFSESQVLANLGPQPEAGASVLGVKVDRVYSTHKVKGIDNLLEVRTKIPTDKVEATIKELNNVMRWFHGQKLLCGQAAIKVLHWVKPSKKGYEYKKVFSKEENRDVLTLAADTMSAPQAFAQAFAAHCWEHHLPQRTRVSWMTLLLKLRHVTTCSKDDLLNLLDSYTKSEEPDIRSLHNLVDEENASLVVKTIIKHFRTVHGIAPSEIDMLCRENPERVGNLWPEWTTFTEARPEFPAHALTNARNLFAYAIGCAVQGPKAIPKSLQKAVEVSLSKMERKHL